MATYQVAVYSPADITLVSLGGPNYRITIAPGATPTIITVNDTDTGTDETIFNDGNPSTDGGSGIGTPNQIFTGTINGTTYTNQTINPEWMFETNPGSGSVFSLYPGDGGTLIGYGFTFEPTAGESYVFSINNGTFLPNIDQTDIFVCFTRGTEIETVNGPVLIENLQVGDMVWTESAGFQPLQWIGSHSVRATSNSAPVRIKAGTFGASRDLLVSQQHRMLVSGPMVEIMFGVSKILAAAKHLINGETVYLDHSMETVEYFHILFEKHEIVLANSCLSESFHPGPVALNALENAQREEVLMLFPELSDMCNEQKMIYPELRAFEARAIALS